MKIDGGTVISQNNNNLHLQLFRYKTEVVKV